MLRILRFTDEWGFMSIHTLLLCVALIFTNGLWLGYWLFSRRQAKKDDERVQRLNERLEASEERFEWFAEKSRDIVYQMSVPEGQYTYINRAGLEYHKFTREEFLSQPMLIVQMLHPDYLEVFRTEWAAICEGRPFAPEQDFRIYNKAGELRWLHHDVCIITDPDTGHRYMDGLVVDITDQKRTENALRDSQANLRRAQEVARLGVWRLDGVAGTLEWSAHTYQIHGMEEGTKVARDCFVDLAHPMDREAFQAVWSGALEGKSFDIEYRIIVPSTHETRWLFNRAEPEYDDMGAHLGAVGVIQDITERKHLEAELLQAQKMEAVGTLAGGIAHDFNNILGVILGYTERMTERAKHLPDLASDLEHILDSVERGRNLIRQIVTFSHKLEPKRAPVDLNAEITRVSEVWKRILPRSVQVGLELASDLRLVSADANQLDQVLMNLATNAVDAMPGGGRLTVKSENVVMDAMSCSQCGKSIEGDMVRITVSDTGIGIPPEHLGKIFESFFTTKDVGRGTGLGLSSALGIMHRHEGHIECESTPGMGTSFRLYLPAQAGRATPLPRAVTAREETATGVGTLLVVDDEQDLLEINAAALESFGYKVIVANGGRDALDKYAKHWRGIDLIVSDLNMPGISADKYVSGILTINPNAKIVITSGYLNVAEASPSISNHVAFFLSKPCRRADLRRAVRDVLDGYARPDAKETA